MNLVRSKVVILQKLITKSINEETIDCKPHMLNKLDRGLSIVSTILPHPTPSKF